MILFINILLFVLQLNNQAIGLACEVVERVLPISELAQLTEKTFRVLYKSNEANVCWGRFKKHRLYSSPGVIIGKYLP